MGGRRCRLFFLWVAMAWINCRTSPLFSFVRASHCGSDHTPCLEFTNPVYAPIEELPTSLLLIANPLIARSLSVPSAANNAHQQLSESTERRRGRT